MHEIYFHVTNTQCMYKHGYAAVKKIIKYVTAVYKEPNNTS